METKTKKTLLISTIIILIAINISALLTIYYHNKIQTKRAVEMKNIKEESRIKGMHRYIKEELRLSDDQFEVFKEISKTNMNSSHEISIKLNKNRFDMMNEIAKVNPNLNTLDSLAKDIGLLHYELKKSTISHFLKLKEICNDDQQENLQKLFMKLINEQDKNDLKRNQRRHGRNRNGSPHNKN
ncbi:MAG: hypothetical protein GQ564_19250 [Bacteroidales bacterium]|nr:hypothetical protein [Bacteroidales bacterium]